MEFEDHHEFETAEQFWQKLDETVAQPCGTHELIDNALRSYLALTTNYPDYVESESDLRHCAYKLYSSALFGQHADYVRTQFIHCLLQDDEPHVLHITSTFLLADARENETTFEMLNGEGVFPRMLDLIRAPKQDGEEGLHRLLMELVYEMARLQKITNDDLTCVNDDFICCLFDIIEQVSDDVDDPYHYPVIRVLLVLNEQFMVAAHDPTVIQHQSSPLTNKVIKVLSSHGSKYKTFGENIILLLNREDETSLQLLTLKLFYLLFTTPSTYEYFYTNDLHVLVDILIRNLLDLPEEAAPLRHTYLRVLYPLLEHTQLQNPPHYKRDELRKLLSVMAGDKFEDADDAVVCHFEDVDETTKRLVKRCQTVSWLTIPVTEMPQVESPVDAGPIISITSDSLSKTAKAPPAIPAPRKLKKRSSSRSSDIGLGPYLNSHLDSARHSNLSVMEMAAQKERPGVKTPRRNPSIKHGLRGIVMQKKEKPPLPKARRSGPKRSQATEGTTLEETSPTSDTAELPIPQPLPHTDSGADILNDSLDSDETTPAEAKPKKPPPAPKARRWRGKRSKDDKEVVRENTREPGKFHSDLPSLNTATAGQPPENSPFSPPTDKTLSPETSDLATFASKSKRISSVSAALSKAQIQAIQSIEETFERVHLDISSPSNHGNGDRSGLRNETIPEILDPTPNTDVERNSPKLSRVVLAPPGQAPQRGIPGPQMQLERSPFLGEDDSEERLILQTGTMDAPENKDDDTTNIENDYRDNRSRKLEAAPSQPRPQTTLPKVEEERNDSEKSEDEWNELE